MPFRRTARTVEKPSAAPDAASGMGGRSQGGDAQPLAASGNAVRVQPGRLRHRGWRSRLVGWIFWLHCSRNNAFKRLRNERQIVASIARMGLQFCQFSKNNRWKLRQMSFVKSEKKEHGDGPSLMCSAHGCPLRWSVKIESPLCTFHAWEDEKQWHWITESLRLKGFWIRPIGPESHTVRDMKTRMRSGFRFTSLDEKRAA